MRNSVVDVDFIHNILEKSKNNFSENVLFQILEAVEYRPLTDLEAAIILSAPIEYNDVIFNIAKKINEIVFKKKIKFYGVVYPADFCIETCTYCGDNIFSNRFVKDGESEFQNVVNPHKHFLNVSQLKDDVSALLFKYPELSEICLLAGNSPNLTIKRWIQYLEAVYEVFDKKIILNIQPPTLHEFQTLRNHFKDKILQFRIFQETYEPQEYSKQHYSYKNLDTIKNKTIVSLKNKGIIYPSKNNYLERIFSQDRALIGGFNEVGLGVLFGLNNSASGPLFEALALKQHGEYLKNYFGVYPKTISFPRVLPSKGVKYDVPRYVSDEEFTRIICTVRLALPFTELIITCRESPEFRSYIRPIINMEDFEARPGPGGNTDAGVDYQMEITDRRKGGEIMQEIIDQGYIVTP